MAAQPPNTPPFPFFAPRGRIGDEPVCKLLTVTKTSSPAVEAVEDRRLSFKFEKNQLRDVVAEPRHLEVRAFTVTAKFAGEPSPADILDAQHKAGLPMKRFPIFPATVAASQSGGVWTAVWKVGA